MDINSFIENFSNQFENTDTSSFSSNTKFRELDEWSSLVALSVIAMIDEEYDVQIKADKMRNTKTIQELFELVKTQKN